MKSGALPRLVAFALAVFAASAKAQPTDPGSGVRRVTPIVEVVRKVGPNVVNLYASVEYLRTSWTGLRLAETGALGAGVIIHPSGIVVTNSHVITANIDTSALRDVEVRVSYRPNWQSDETRQYDATLIGFDPGQDLAMLKINDPGPFPAAVLGTSADLMIGETVVAVGNPYGREGSVTHGIISATNRRLAGPAGDEFSDLIQTDAPLNAGNSGGPLFNILGELIGINQAIGVDYKLGRAEGQGLAIPVDRVRSLLEQKFNPYALGHSYFGMYLEDTEFGVRVAEVASHSPADRAGIRSNDLIVEAAGFAIDERLSFNLAALSSAPGSPLDVVVKRDRERHTLTLRPLSIEDTVHRRLGVELIVNQDFPGPIISRVYPSGPAADLGLMKHDVIFELDGRPVRSYLDVFRSILGAKDGELDVAIYRYRDLRQPRYRKAFSGTLRLNTF